METHPTYITPDALRHGVAEMAHQAGRMLRLVRDAFLRPLAPMPAQVGELGRAIHTREKPLTSDVTRQLREFPWSLGAAQHLAFLPAGLERVGDCAEALSRAVENMHREGVPFSEQATTDVVRLFDECATLLDAIEGAVRLGDRASLAAVVAGGGRVRALCEEAALGHEERLVQAVCVPRASSLFLALLDYFREISRYAERMAPQVDKALAAA